jgi:hypothetical protein
MNFLVNKEVLVLILYEQSLFGASQGSEKWRSRPILGSGE